MDLSADLIGAVVGTAVTVSGGGFIVLKRFGLISTRNGNGNHADKCKFDQDKCDQKHKEIGDYTHALYTSNELQRQRIEQIDKRLAEGSKNFGAINDSISEIKGDLKVIKSKVNGSFK